jgi:hypothetical protein
VGTAGLDSELVELTSLHGTWQARARSGACWVCGSGDVVVESHLHRRSASRHAKAPLGHLRRRLAP